MSARLSHIIDWFFFGNGPVEGLDGDARPARTTVSRTMDRGHFDRGTNFYGR